MDRQADISHRARGYCAENTPSPPASSISGFANDSKLALLFLFSSREERERERAAHKFLHREEGFVRRTSVRAGILRPAPLSKDDQRTACTHNEQLWFGYIQRPLWTIFEVNKRRGEVIGCVKSTSNKVGRNSATVDGRLNGILEDVRMCLDGNEPTCCSRGLKLLRCHRIFRAFRL